MSIINIHGGDKPSTGTPTALVYAKERPIIPFIGVRTCANGSHERVVGVKCPTQEKSVFQVVDSADPLVYLRVWKMLGELKVITDELVQICIKDCIIATQPGNRLWNFSQTSVYQDRGIYRLSMFEDAQKKALAFKPNEGLIEKVLQGFAKHGAPLEGKGASGQLIVTPSASPFVLSPAPKDETDGPFSPISQARLGYYYGGLNNEPRTQAG